jgi:aspartate-semialdehyde dehydrogenase
MTKNLSKKKQQVKIAVVGATGNVGRAMLSILAERDFPAHNITAIASERSAGRQVSYGENHTLPVHPLQSYDFSSTDIALFSPGGKISAQYAPKAAEQGCVVIDNTSHFRMEEDIPLIIPEINRDQLGGYSKRRIIANPNCSTIQLLMALKPLHDIARIKRVVACTYQSVSGAGKEAMDELLLQSKSILVHQRTENSIFTKPIAFNVIPQIDVFMDEGDTKEEWKMAVETQKILDPSIKLVATCVRVPVFIGHAVAAHVEFESPITPGEARKALRAFKGIVVEDNPDDYRFATPSEIAGEDNVYVSRIRKDTSVDHGLSLWVVGDNIRKGAALNAIQIAEELIGHYLHT